MTFARRLLLVLAALAWSGVSPGAAEAENEIIAEALTDASTFSAQQTTNGLVVTHAQGVVIRYTNIVLSAETVVLNRDTLQAEASGGVVIRQGTDIWRSDRLRYNFRTRALSGERFRTGRAPYFTTGESLDANPTNQTYTLHGAVLTTDDVEKPAFFIRANEIRLIEGNRIEARDAVLYVGNVPVMYFPKYSRSLTRHPNFWTATPGYRSLYGPFLLSAYHWNPRTNLHAAINLDFRLKRGVGLGPDLDWNLGRWGEGGLRYYYTQDDDPDVDPLGNPIRDERHRFSFTHVAEPRTNLTFKLVAREQSDPYIIRDFFETEYREDPHPKSFFEASQLWSNWSLNFLVHPQINDFHETVERLPDVKLTGLRQQIGVSPLYYESETSFGYLSFEPDERTALTPFAALRADTYHQVILPWTFFGWLNAAPRVGGRFTHYGESEGPGTTLDEENRAVFNTGVEFTFKASRTWAAARSRLWDVNGLRHIVEPSFNYVYVPHPSRLPRELPQFDREHPTLRLLPVDFPDYNAIDAIDTQNVLRLGLHNRLQTKRSQAIEDLFNWQAYLDWRLDPKRGQSTLGDFYTRLDVRPRSWATLSSELRYDTDRKEMRYSDTYLTISPNDRWSDSIGHLYFREDPRFGPDSDNNLIRNSFYFRMNENWGFRMTHYLEMRDGLLEEQTYTIYRDLRSWTSALSLRFRENRRGRDDFTIAVTFSLKAFPRFQPGQDRDHHSLLLGG